MIEANRREHVCPHCGSRQAIGEPRRGVLDHLERFVGRRVYLCLRCRLRFYDRRSR
jgi:DNA-directed RNA polymerase subunit RPC12/RpoP